jgi:superfamily II DNA or RNA helicase
MPDTLESLSNVPSQFSPGGYVRARGDVWRLRDVKPHGDCVSLTVTRPAAAGGDHSTVLIHPFDKVTLLGGPVAPHMVKPRCLWRSLASRLTTLQRCDALMAPAGAHIDLLPYQLEPVLATIVEGIPRVLLADAVGLGKTIQAGLILAELLARGVAAHVLVLVPPSLRDQWNTELHERLGIEATIVDAEALRRRARRLPRTTSPWLVPGVMIVSLDFAKRPDVRGGLAEVLWDIVIIDEAHLAATGNERQVVADLVARRATRVVLLTATPHSGDDCTFAALTRLGALGPDEPITCFRRSRRDIGMVSHRRWHRLRVRLGPSERHTLRLLRSYASAVWATPPDPNRAAARLAMIVLLKRALSSPRSLLRSVLRRRALLQGQQDDDETQLPLPFDDEADPQDEEPTASLGTPGLGCLADELAWLDQIASAAQRANHEASKLRSVVRFIRRAREPVIVFTEYRDTLSDLFRVLTPVAHAEVLHGGLDRTERRSVLRSFCEGDAPVLLATDAGGIGLNLQRRCRTIINLEVPWNPVRLEQRAGRVDRVGQQRTVHVVDLVARSSPEERLLARLTGRADRARWALADPDPPGMRCADVNWDDVETAETILGLRSRGTGQLPRPHPASAAAPPTALVRLMPVTQAAGQEAQSQARLRQVVAALARSRRGPRRPPHPAAHGPFVTVLRQPARQRRVSQHGWGCDGVVAVFELVTCETDGRLVDETLIPLRLDGLPPQMRTPSSLMMLARQLMGGTTPLLSGRLDEVVADRRAIVTSQHAAAAGLLTAWWEAARDAARVAASNEPIQDGLFDHRAARGIEATLQLRRAIEHARGDPSAGDTGAQDLVTTISLGWLHG